MAFLLTTAQHADDIASPCQTAKYKKIPNPEANTPATDIVNPIGGQIRHLCLFNACDNPKCFQGTDEDQVAAYDQTCDTWF